MIEAIISGKVYGKPAQRSSKTGAAFTVAKLRVATSASESLFVNVIAFSDSAQAALLSLDDGDAAALAGTLTPKVWTDQKGNGRPALDLVAAQVLTAYGLGKKRAAVRGAGEPAPDRTPAPAGPGGDHDGDADDPWLNGGEV